MKTLEQRDPGATTPTDKRLARYASYNASEKGRARRDTEKARHDRRLYWRSPQGLALARERHARHRAARKAFLGMLLLGEMSA